MDIEPREILPPATQETIKDISDGVVVIFEGKEIRDLGEVIRNATIPDYLYGIATDSAGELDYAEMLDPKQFRGYSDVVFKKETEFIPGDSVVLANITLSRLELDKVRNTEYEILKKDGILEMHRHDTFRTIHDEQEKQERKMKQRNMSEEERDGSMILDVGDIMKKINAAEEARKTERALGFTVVSEPEAQELLGLVKFVGKKGKHGALETS